MWPFDHVFHTYTWPGPLGWVAHNTPGNLAASAIAFVAGWLLRGKQIVRELHEKLDRHHNEQMAAHQATQEVLRKN